MFLKRIDILGFKSFANKTNVEFSLGITAVVGPNGSGKSNIADAIQWVLGEQSARSLRGAKMEDVIFSGSDSRKSINFCEVSLTLDNIDHHLPVPFDEVTVTRRLYRSGESEYLLNQAICRLRDIHELFMDSGLGRESYSLVGQGKIEQMLSTRPEDRRGPFEDAAGIVKFKFRRKEAERRLDETAANIVRIDDIVAELNRQAGPLEVEATRARQYELLHGQLSELDISLLLSEVTRVQGRLQDATADVKLWEARRVEAVASLQTSQQALRQARTQLERHTTAVETVQRQLIDAVQQRQRQDGDVALLQERLASTKRESADKQQQLAQVQDEQREAASRKSEQAERLQVLQGALEAKTAQLEAAAHGVDPAARTALEAEQDRLNAEIIEHHHNAATFRNEIKSAEEALQTDERRGTRFTAEWERWQTELAALTAEATALNEQLGVQTVLREELESTRTARTGEFQETGRQESECTGKIHQTESAAASLRSRFELLKDLAQGYDGYAQGAKTVLQAAAKGQMEGIHGSLAGLITVDQHYELAIETALGAASQNIVVATEAAARAAIAMLKARQSGRATFMPLDVLRSRQIGDQEHRQAASVDGFVGMGSELVKTESAYQTAVEHLLGNVLIAQTLPAANDIARRLGYRVRVVTVEGDVVSPGGIMSGGGHARKGPGLLGRAREQQDVAARLADAAQQLEQLRVRQQGLRKAAVRLQQEQDAIGAKLRENRRVSDEAESALRELRSKEQSANERLQSLRWEQEQLESGRSNWQTRRAQAALSLQETQAALADLEAQLRTLRSSLESWDASVLRAQESMTTLKVEVATLSQERAGIVERITEVDLRMERLADRTQQLTAELAAGARLSESTQRGIETGQEASGQLVERVAALEAELTQWKQARVTAEAEVSQGEQQVNREQSQLTSAEEQAHRAFAASERADIELNHLLERLGEQYQMTYEWAIAHHEPAADVEGTRRATEDLRLQMRALGNVRLGAIEEWERVSERMAFLSRERDDLESARDQLAGVIGEIDEEMSRRFAETFEQIRSEFQVMFKLLFNGGRADLTLTDPDDLLSAGIDVLAQPPGKRLQNLNLLSGGERALTAMALLFAILRVRPVPFCVLDEVEAALDEANVVRFAQQLRRFSDETQFIVITHRRGTMEEADALYGVTMQESGISKMISVRLDDEDTETA